MRFITLLLLIANFFSELKAYCLSHSIPLLYIYYYYVLKNFIVSDGFGWFLSDTLFSYHDAFKRHFKSDKRNPCFFCDFSKELNQNIFSFFSYS